MASAIPKSFWSSPGRYLKWAFHEKPAIAYSVAIGCLGPVSLVALPPLRRAFGDEDPIRIPLSYPIPEGPRKAVPAGYEDPEPDVRHKR